MSTVGPVDHIARLPLPWRETADLTECGRPVIDYPGRIITRDDLARRIRDVGKQRTAFSTCMTCTDTVQRWQPIRRDDRAGLLALAREIEAVQYATPPRPRTVYSTTERGARDHQHAVDRWARKARLIAELDAVVALIAAHRDEYDAYLSGLAETTSLDEARQRTRRAR